MCYLDNRNGTWPLCSKGTLMDSLDTNGFQGTSGYTHAISSFPPSFLTVNHHNFKNWVPSILANNLWLILMGMKQKKIKMADSKKLSFSTSPKGIDLAQPIWPWGSPTYAQKRPKNTKKAFFGCFRPYVGQPDDHIGWAKTMPFASINPTNPRTNPWNFGGNCSAFGDVEKLSFFESAILNFFFKKKIFFCFIPMKISHKFCVRMDGT